jgi:Zn-dependent peptidase ImmA (M78 family)/transcriptional regulator with XRE-family HTH domain
MSEALISPCVVNWAMQRGRRDSADVAGKVGVTVEKVESWSNGTAKPTFRQAQDLARVLRIPFGFLFLSKPPKESLAIPDLRTMRSEQTRWLSLDFRDVLSDVLRKQEWYRDFRLERGFEQLVFVGKFKQSSSASDVASDMAKELGLTLADRDHVRQSDEFLNLLVKKAEELGICVMRSSMVGNDSHRGLDLDEFRGFVVCDDIAPMVFINSSDARAAQVFTLAHELAHLWIGESGISNLSIEQSSRSIHDHVEKLCNAIAAEVLVPKEALLQKWHMGESLSVNAGALAGYFRVSTVVIGRCAYDLNLIAQSDYVDFYQQQSKLWVKPTQRKESRPDFYRTLIPMRNGKRFTVSVVHSVLENHLLLRDAGALLGVHPSTVSQLAQKLGTG